MPDTLADSTLLFIWAWNLHYNALARLAPCQPLTADCLALWTSETAVLVENITTLPKHLKYDESLINLKNNAGYKKCKVVLYDITRNLSYVKSLLNLFNYIHGSPI